MPPEKSTSLPNDEAGDDRELKQLDQSHGEVLENPQKFVSCGHKSTGNATGEQEVSRDETCNNRCGMHEHLLFDILLWLPVISLLRFKTVRKSWCALIGSSTFITQHFSHNCSKDCLLGLHRTPPDYLLKLHLLSGRKYEECSILDSKEHRRSIIDLSYLANSCNGIVLISRGHWKRSDALWNPATKQLRFLPEASYHLFNENNHSEAGIGLGFDVISKDYKVISINSEFRNPHRNVVEVYSLRTNSWWTIHKDDVLPFRYIDNWKPVYKSGKSFWVGIDVEYSPILISFDWSDEIFETMPLPEEPSFLMYGDRHHKRYQTLGFLNDNLSYIKGVDRGMYDRQHIYFEIWVSVENDGKTSWNKVCKISPKSNIYMDAALYPMGFSNNGEFLLLGSQYGNQLQGLFNFDDIREDENLKVKQPKYCIQDCVRYNESLISLKRENGAYL